MLWATSGDSEGTADESLPQFFTVLPRNEAAPDGVAEEGAVPLEMEAQSMMPLLVKIEEEQPRLPEQCASKRVL